jgi:RimJ/RimL family protein N-acetyltransferase
VSETEAVRLRGERVLLRPCRPDEFDLLYERAQQSTTRVGELTPGRLQIRITRSGRLVDGRLDLGIEVDGVLVGSIEARAPAGALPPGVCELGIELFPECRGKGLGTEAVLLLTGHLLGEGFARVQASTDVSNRAMRRVLEKAGFVYEGTLRGFMPDRDGRVDYALYAVTDRDAGGGRR